MHSIFSDGVLGPFELVRRASEAGYRAMALTDHVDTSNMDLTIPRIVRAFAELAPHTPVKLIPGAELTHIPPALMEKLTREARSLGAALVVAHGETLVEPVEEGTNRAAIEARVDILAHPGLITPEEVKLAAEYGVALEITARKGHSLSNGHVARLAREFGARLVINTDSHAPGDLVSRQTAALILLGAGLSPREVETVFENSQTLVNEALRRINA